MRRAVLTLGGTVAGLAALFSYKTHVPGVAPVAEPSAPTGLTASAPASPTAAATPSASPSKTKEAAPKAAPTTAPPTLAPPTTAPTTAAPTTAAPDPTQSKKPTPAPTTPAPAPSTSAPAGPSGTFTGQQQSAGQYGEVQVQITVSDGKITAASDQDPTDDSIGAGAVSQLDSEVVADQSGNVNAVSGATYTSQAYIASLQQAIDSAGL